MCVSAVWRVVRDTSSQAAPPCMPLRLALHDHAASPAAARMAFFSACSRIGPARGNTAAGGWAMEEAAPR